MPTPHPAAFAPALAYSRARQGLTLVISHGGQILFSHCADGLQLTTPLPIASGTKSLAALLAAFAIQDGLCEGWDEPVAQTLREWQTDVHTTANPDSNQAQITIRQLLSLTGGWPGGRSTLFGGSLPSYAQAAATPPNTRPNQRFQYGPIPFQLLGEVLQRKLQDHGRDPNPQTYASTCLFAPLGIQVGGWSVDAQGLPHLATGLELSALDWVKFGQLIANTGQWQGQPLLAASLVRACLQGSLVNPAYGLGFWLNRDGLNVAGRPWRALVGQSAKLVMALGAGNQNLYIDPDRDLVIARQGTMTLPLPDFDHGAFLALIDQALEG